MGVDYKEGVHIVLQGKGLYIIFTSRRIMAFNRKERTKNKISNLSELMLLPLFWAYFIMPPTLKAKILWPRT